MATVEQEHRAADLREAADAFNLAAREARKVGVHIEVSVESVSRRGARGPTLDRFTDLPVLRVTTRVDV